MEEKLKVDEFMSLVASNVYSALRFEYFSLLKGIVHKRFIPLHREERFLSEAMFLLLESFDIEDMLCY